MAIIAIIPARYNSKRFPGKLLTKIKTKPLLQWVYEKAVFSNFFDRVLVATPDIQIIELCKSLGIEYAVSYLSHSTGTDRCAEISRDFSPEDIIYNIQGDEPLIPLYAYKEFHERFCEDDQIEIASICTVFRSLDDVTDPNQVKVVTNHLGEAIYFSRSLIPSCKNKEDFKLDAYKKHVGIYVFRNRVLQDICALPQSSLELIEGLEQLRWIENGRKIHMLHGFFPHISINIFEDVAKAEALMNEVI